LKTRALPVRSSALQSRFLAIVQDAAALIEARRIAPGHELAIQLRPPADARKGRSDIGDMV